MRQVVYFFTTIFLIWLFQHISVTGDEPRVMPYELFLNSAANQVTGELSGKITDQTFLKRLDETTYSVHTINTRGDSVRKILLPPPVITKESGEKISLQGKPGFLTAPDDGSYYLWYPRLGSQIYFFDHEGRFIWDKPESRYLLSSERGKYLLAAAGDHSRMMLLNPDMKTLLDFEGLLFIAWQISDNERNVLQICLFSLDGEIIVGKADPAFFTRKRITQNIKSGYCNLQSGKFGLITEKTFSDKKNPAVITYEDFLISGKIKVDSENNNIGTKTEIIISDEISLKNTSPRKLPLVISGEFSVVLTENKGKPVALLQTEGSTEHTEIFLDNVLSGEFNADEWKGHHHNSVIFMRNEKHLLVFDKYGLNYSLRAQNIMNSRTEGNVLMVQSSQNIAGFELR